MTGLKEWALTVCVVSVVGALLNMLIPDAKYEKLLRLCISAFVVCACLSPMLTLKDSCGSLMPEINANEYSERIDSLNGHIEKQAVSTVERVVRSTAASRIEMLGVKRYEIIISTDISENGCISILRIEIDLPESDAITAQLIKTEMEKTLGIETVVKAGRTDE